MGAVADKALEFYALALKFGWVDRRLLESTTLIS
jgi:hypothetical protein